MTTQKGFQTVSQLVTAELDYKLGKLTPNRAPNEEMLSLGPTDDLQAELDKALSLGGSSDIRINHLRRLTEKAKTRDALIAARREQGEEYRTCWCLGLGGRDTYTIGVRTDAGALAPMVPQADGSVLGPFTGHREYCECPIGVALLTDERQQAEDLTRAYRALSRRRRAEHARIPSHYDELDIDSWLYAIKDRANADAIAASERIALDVGAWLDPLIMGKAQPPHLLFMAGGYGNGKTGLAAYIGRAVLSNGGTVTMRKTAEILAELRAAPWRSRGTDNEERPLTEHELVVRASEDDLLILDDLGAEALVGAQADRAIEALLLIIDARLSNNRPTVITTNEPSDVLKERIGERLLDRLIGGSMSRPLIFTAIPSLRRSSW